MKLESFVASDDLPTTDAAMSSQLPPSLPVSIITSSDLSSIIPSTAAIKGKSTVSMDSSTSSSSSVPFEKPQGGQKESDTQEVLSPPPSSTLSAPSLPRTPLTTPIANKFDFYHKSLTPIAIKRREFILKKLQQVKAMQFTSRDLSK